MKTHNMVMKFWGNLRRDLSNFFTGILNLQNTCFDYVRDISQVFDLFWSLLVDSDGDENEIRY